MGLIAHAGAEPRWRVPLFGSNHKDPVYDSLESHERRFHHPLGAGERQSFWEMRGSYGT